jgi:putative transposase
VTDRPPDALASTVAKGYGPSTTSTTRSSPRRSWRRWRGSSTAPTRVPPPASGLAETLTIGRLGVPPTPARTLRSTNSIEAMIAICRDHAANVKRWRDGQMVLRWVAAGMGEAAEQFRRVNGYLHLPAVRVALDRTVAAATPSKEDAAA